MIPDTYEPESMVRTKAEIEIRRIEAQSNAKEVASKAVGKYGLIWIVVLVVVGVGSAKFLPSEALSPVVGLLTSAVMAIIAMMTGITGTKDREEKPEFKIIDGLIQRLEESNEPMEVVVDGNKVTVTKGQSRVAAKRT